MRPGDNDSISELDVDCALWYWSTGDVMSDIADMIGITEQHVEQLLRRQGVLGRLGRDVAAGLAAERLTRNQPIRWTVVDPDVVAISITRSEAAMIGRGQMLHPDSDIQADAALTTPLLLALSTALSPEESDDTHWRAAGRLARTPGGGAKTLVTTRRMPGGEIMASVHDLAIGHGLLLVDVLPRAWIMAADDGSPVESHGLPDHIAAMKAVIEIEVGRHAGDAVDNNDAIRDAA